MPGAPLRSVPTGADVSAASATDRPTDSLPGEGPPGEDRGIAADTLDVDLEQAAAASVDSAAVVTASLIDFLR